MTYYSTPFPCYGLSPAELLMGRRLRCNIPLLTSQLTPNWKFLKEFRPQNERFEEKQKKRVSPMSWSSKPNPHTRRLRCLANHRRLTSHWHSHTDSQHSKIFHCEDTNRASQMQQATPECCTSPPGGLSVHQSTSTATCDPIVTCSRSGTVIHPQETLTEPQAGR